LVHHVYSVLPSAASIGNLFNCLERLVWKILLVDHVGFKPLTNYIAVCNYAVDCHLWSARAELNYIANFEVFHNRPPARVRVHSRRTFYRLALGDVSVTRTHSSLLTASVAPLARPCVGQRPAQY